MHRKKVALVDHNEKDQAVDNIDKAEIVEIIDHHKLGSLETMVPIFFQKYSRSDVQQRFCMKCMGSRNLRFHRVLRGFSVLRLFQIH